MSLAEWRGKRFEYGVKVEGDGIQTYISEVSVHEGWARSAAKRHEGKGISTSIVARPVIYGDWSPVSSGVPVDQTGGEKE